MKNYISDRDLKSYMIIAMILAIMFWVAFWFHPIFFLLAITTNAIQILLLVESRHRANLTSKKK